MAATCACASNEASLNACPVHGEHGSELYVEMAAAADDADFARREAEAARDELAARLHAAHDALTRITDADDDHFNTLESTVEYVIMAYRSICESEAASGAELTTVRAELERKREYGRVRARVVCELNAELARLRVEYHQARDALDREKARRRWVVARDGGRDCASCYQEIRRGEAYETGDPDAFEHIHCPNGLTIAESRERLGLPATNEGAPTA